jgi:hypothetical protein
MGTYSEEDVDLDNVEVEKATTAERKGLFKQLASMFGLDVVEKGAMADLFQERNRSQQFWTAYYALQDTLCRYDSCSYREELEADETKVREALEDFSKIVTEILTGSGSVMKAIVSEQPVRKAGKKMSSKNKETLCAIYESLGTFLKEFDDPDDDPDKKEDGSEGAEGSEKKTDKEDTQVTKQDLEKAVEAAVTKALGSTAPEQQPQEGGEAVAKAQAAPGADPAAEITPEAIEKMVESAIEKAMQPREEAITSTQMEEMINSAVAKALDPVLKSRGLPSNLGTGTVEKQEEHFLHGIL